MVVGTLIIPTHNYSFLVQEIQDWKEGRGLNPHLNIENIISNVEFRKSSGIKIEPLIQIVDILIGGIGFVRNGNYDTARASKVKKALVDHIEKYAKTRLLYDTSISAPFNIWTFEVEKSMRASKKYKKIALIPSLKVSLYHGYSFRKQRRFYYCPIEPLIYHDGSAAKTFLNSTTFGREHSHYNKKYLYLQYFFHSITF